MAIFAHAKKEKPAWLGEARKLCRDAGIAIVGWGPDMLTVEAKSPDRAKEIAAQLGPLGFRVVENEDNAYAGLLDLSLHPEAIQAKLASHDVSRRRWDEQITPVIWLIGSLLLLPGLFPDRGRYWITLPLGIFSLAMLFWDGSRIWGWRLEILPEALRVRRRFRWTSIPWQDIRTVETVEAGRSDERVVLKLASHKSEQLGKFGCVYARNMRDRLRHEIAHGADHSSPRNSS